VRILTRAIVRYVSRTPWTSAIVLMGAAVGVASVVAVHLLSVAVGNSLERQAVPHLASVSHVATRQGATMADYFVLRRAWRAGELPGVSGMWPVVEGHVRADSAALRIVGWDWFASDLESAGGWGESVRAHVYAGDAPGVVADAAAGLQEGQVLSIGTRHFSVIGVVDAGSGATLYMDIGDALWVLDAPEDRLDFVVMRLMDPLAGIRRLMENLLPGASAALPNTVSAIAGWTVRSIDALQPEMAFSRSVLFNLGALGSLSLVVAWFLIFEAAVVWLRRQREVFDRLYALGVQRDHLRRRFLGGLLVLGVAATLFGMLLGVFLVRVLTTITVSGMGEPPEPTLDAAVIAKAAFSGVVVSLAGGWLAWRRGPEQRVHSVSAWTVLVVIAVLTGAGVGFEAAGVAGAFTAILGVSLGGVWLVGPALRQARGRLRHLRGPVLIRLGLRETAWYVEDLSVALSALVLAIATSLGVGLMVDSFRGDFQTMLDQRLAHDAFIELPDGDVSGVARLLRSIDDEVITQVYGRRSLTVDGVSVSLGYARFDAAEASRYGHGATLGLDETIVNEGLLSEFGLRVGERLVVGGRRLLVVGVFAGYGDFGARALISTNTAAMLWSDLSFDRLSVSSARLEQLLISVAEHFPSASVQRRDGMRATALRVFDRTFAITRALTLMALFVAFIGLYNAIVAMRLNQRATSQLLTVMGISGSEMALIGLVRSLTIACVAVLLAMPIGVAMGSLLCSVLNPRAFGWTVGLELTGSAIWPPAVLGLVAALFAGLLPHPRERVGVS